MTTAVTGHNSHESRLLYVTDRRTGTQFLVDTGAEVSVVPPTALEKKTPQTETKSREKIRGQDIRQKTFAIAFRFQIQLLMELHHS